MVSETCEWNCNAPHFGNIDIYMYIYIYTYTRGELTLILIRDMERRVHLISVHL